MGMQDCEMISSTMLCLQPGGKEGRSRDCAVLLRRESPSKRCRRFETPAPRSSGARLRHTHWNPRRVRGNTVNWAEGSARCWHCRIKDDRDFHSPRAVSKPIWGLFVSSTPSRHNDAEVAVLRCRRCCGLRALVASRNPSMLLGRRRSLDFPNPGSLNPPKSAQNSSETPLISFQESE